MDKFEQIADGEALEDLRAQPGFYALLRILKKKRDDQKPTHCQFPFRSTIDRFKSSSAASASSPVPNRNPIRQ